MGFTRGGSQGSPLFVFPARETFILVAGLVVAVGAGVFGYRSVGMYGDGAFAGGLHRERDPQTGKSLLIHEAMTSRGKIRRIFTTHRQLEAVQLDVNADGRVEESVTVQNGALAGVGFSLAGDGVIDAWAYRDSNGQLSRIEVSTKRDGRIDRWEHYTNGLMVRVDLDTNGNGRPDRWQTYEGGILMDTFVDANEDGRADKSPVR